MPVILQATTATSGDATWTEASAATLISYQSAIPISPGNTVLDRFFPPSAMTLTGFWLFAATAPASAAGTYTFDLVNITKGLTILGLGPFNMETLVSGSWEEMDMSDTPGVEDFDAHDEIRATFASDNADLTGAGLYWGLFGTPV